MRKRRRVLTLGTILFLISVAAVIWVTYGTSDFNENSAKLIGMAVSAVWIPTFIVSYFENKSEKEWSWIKSLLTILLWVFVGFLISVKGIIASH